MHASEMIQSNPTQTEDGVAQSLFSLQQHHNVSRCSNSSSPLRLICIPSKAIFLVLAWTLVVSELIVLCNTCSSYNSHTSPCLYGTISSCQCTIISSELDLHHASSYWNILSTQWFLSWCIVQDHSTWSNTHSDFIHNFCCPVWYSVNNAHQNLSSVMKVTPYVTGISAAFFITLG